jgi:transposase
MTDILQLDGWEPTKTYDQGKERITEARYIEPIDCCQKCGVIGRLYRHGTKEVSIRDTPVFGRPSIIRATIQRYKCRDCGETFLPSMLGIDPSRRMTARCVDMVKDLCVDDRFTRIAKQVGCVEGTIRNIAAEKFESLHSRFVPYLPQWMGMDETLLAGRQRGVITDLGARKPIDLLRDREKPTVIKWLSQFKDKDTVKGLAIDMWPPYRDAARIVFPGLPVVIDKFHLVKKANEGLEAVRIKVQREKPKPVRVAWKRSRKLLLMRHSRLNDKGRLNLDMWLDNEPEVGQAYWLKERLFNIYSMPKDEAIAAFDSFPDEVPASMKKEFNDLTRAMRNWRTEILNFFDYPITNGYTEAFNGVAKVMNREGRGYAFSNLRARLLVKNPRLLPEAKPPRKFSNDATERSIGGRCACCGGVFDVRTLVMEHIMPLSPPSAANTVFICQTCNSRFHTEWAKHGIPLST